MGGLGETGESGPGQEWPAKREKRVERGLKETGVGGRGGQKGKLSKERHRAMLVGGGEGDGLEGGLRGGWNVRGLGNAGPSNTPV